MTLPYALVQIGQLAVAQELEKVSRGRIAPLTAPTRLIRTQEDAFKCQRGVTAAPQPRELAPDSHCARQDALRWGTAGENPGLEWFTLDRLPVFRLGGHPCSEFDLPNCAQQHPEWRQGSASVRLGPWRHHCIWNIRQFEPARG